MYKPQLKTFVCAAQTGSFSKAAKMQSISAAAVVKQIDALEKEWKVTLFWRTHTGLVLTPEGAQLLQNAKHIIAYADSALSRVKGYPEAKQTLCIGVSRLTSTPFLHDLLPPIRKRCPDLQIQMVTFENKPDISRSMLQNFGQGIDLIIAMCDPKKKRKPHAASSVLGTGMLCHVCFPSSGRKRKAEHRRSFRSVSDDYSQKPQ